MATTNDLAADVQNIDLRMSALRDQIRSAEYDLANPKDLRTKQDCINRRVIELQEQLAAAEKQLAYITNRMDSELLQLQIDEWRTERLKLQEQRETLVKQYGKEVKIDKVLKENKTELSQFKKLAAQMPPEVLREMLQGMLTPVAKSE